MNKKFKEIRRLLDQDKINMAFISADTMLPNRLIISSRVIKVTEEEIQFENWPIIFSSIIDKLEDDKIKNNTVILVSINLALGNVIHKYTGRIFAPSPELGVNPEDLKGYIKNNFPGDNFCHDYLSLVLTYKEFKKLLDKQIKYVEYVKKESIN